MRRKLKLRLKLKTNVYVPLLALLFVVFLAGCGFQEAAVSVHDESIHQEKSSD